MTESFAAISFYVGLAALSFGSIRAVRASLERSSSDSLAFASLVFGGVCFAIAVSLFVRGPRGVLPF